MGCPTVNQIWGISPEPPDLSGPPKPSEVSQTLLRPLDLCGPPDPHSPPRPLRTPWTSQGPQLPKTPWTSQGPTGPPRPPRPLPGRVVRSGLAEAPFHPCTISQGLLQPNRASLCLQPCPLVVSILSGPGWSRNEAGDLGSQELALNLSPVPSTPCHLSEPRFFTDGSGQRLVTPQSVSLKGWT